MELSDVMQLLEANADEQYRGFNESLIPGAENSSLGVRLPKLRQIAKTICRGDWAGFLEDSRDTRLYEITMLRGLVIAGASCPFDTRLELLAGFIPEIDNWGVCDSVAASLKSVRTHLPETWAFLQPHLESREEFRLRFGIVMLMDYFLTEEYIDLVLEILADVRHSGYYVKMAVAWALSACCLKFRDRTLRLLQSGRLDPWTQNKAISKCRDSYRVSSEDKELLVSLRRQSAR